MKQTSNFVKEISIGNTKIIVYSNQPVSIHVDIYGDITAEPENKSIMISDTLDEVTIINVDGIIVVPLKDKVELNERWMNYVRSVVRKLKNDPDPAKKRHSIDKFVVELLNNKPEEMDNAYYLLNKYGLIRDYFLMKEITLLAKKNKLDSETVRELVSNYPDYIIPITDKQYFGVYLNDDPDKVKKKVKIMKKIGVRYFKN